MVVVGGGTDHVSANVLTSPHLPAAGHIWETVAVGSGAETTRAAPGLSSSANAAFACAWVIPTRLGKIAPPCSTQVFGDGDPNTWEKTWLAPEMNASPLGDLDGHDPLGTAEF